MVEHLPFQVFNHPKRRFFAAATHGRIEMPQPSS